MGNSKKTSKKKVSNKNKPLNIKKRIHKSSLKYNIKHCTCKKNQCICNINKNGKKIIKKKDQKEIFRNIMVSMNI